MPTKSETFAACWPWQKLLLLDKELLEPYAPSDSIFVKKNGGQRTRSCGNCMQSIVKHNFSNHDEFCEQHKLLEKKCQTITSRLSRTGKKRN